MEFKLTETESLRAKDFKEKHGKSCKTYNKFGFPSGPLYSYIFTPNGIGTGVEIKCTRCEEIKDITDIDSW